MKISLIPLLLSSTIMASGGALACQGPMHHGNKDVIGHFDTDNSGTVSAQEFDTMRSARMEQLARMGHQMPAWAQPPQFSEMDTDADGELSADEMRSAMATYRQAMHEKRRAMHDSRRAMHRSLASQSGRHPYCYPHQQKPHHQGKGKGKQHQPPAFEEIDTDKDGMISADEFAQHQKQRHAAKHTD